MARNGGLEFQRYASIVAQQLAARGYTPATSTQGANMIVQLGYGVDGGQVYYQSDPFGGMVTVPMDTVASDSATLAIPDSVGVRPFYYGWNDPFWYGGGIDSYIEYHSQLDLHIRQKGTNAPLFDGRAQARSSTSQLDALVPSLIEAMFTGFPGQSGETIKITIPTGQTHRPLTIDHEATIRPAGASPAGLFLCAPLGWT